MFIQDKTFLDTNTYDLEKNYEHSISNLLFIVQKVNELANNEKTDELLSICKQLSTYTKDVIECKEKRNKFDKRVQELYNGGN